MIKTKKLLELSDSTGYKDTYYIYKGKKWTPTNCCIEHDNYYEIAKLTHYLRIDKNTMEITSNYKDVEKFKKFEGWTAKVLKG